MKPIVVTGGPCAGKTSALVLLRERFEGAGVPAVFIPEAATDLIESGVAPWTCSSVREFQTRVIALQLERERKAVAEARAVGPDALIICDRGVFDSRAYLNEADFGRALADNGLDLPSALARYGAVFHLETVAKVDRDSYTQANNAARFENAAEAVQADARTLAAWSAHPQLRVVAGEKDFSRKVERLAVGILNYMRE